MNRVESSQHIKYIPPVTSLCKVKNSGEDHPNTRGTRIVEQLMYYICDKISPYVPSSHVWVFFESKWAHVKSAFSDVLQSWCLFSVFLLKSLNSQLRDFWQQERWWLCWSEKMIYGDVLVLSLRRAGQDGCNSHLIYIAGEGRERCPSQGPIALSRNGGGGRNWNNPFALYDLFIHPLR